MAMISKEKTMNSRIKQSDFRAEAVTWKGNTYTKYSVDDLCQFICWLTKNTSHYFFLTIEGKPYRVEIRNESNNFIAVCPEYYDGFPSPFICQSRISREEALRGLAEQISERVLAETF